MYAGDQELLLNSLISHEYHTVVILCISEGTGRTVHAVLPLWKRTLGTVFNYDQAVTNFLMEVSSDINPRSIAESMRISAIERALEKEDLYKIHFSVRGENGYELHEASFFRMDEDHIVLTVRNITSAFRAVSESVDHLSEALQSAEAEAKRRNSFLNLMSRTLRSPLYSIMGLTYIASQSKNGPLDREDYLHKISMSGSYMNESIEDILELRRIATEDIRLHPEPVVLNRVLSDVLHLATPIAQGKDLLLSADASGVKTRSFLADPQCLRQILQKMLRSAIFYTGDGGCIQLKVQELFCSKRMVTMEFSVESRGVVLDKERLTSLFRPYNFLQDTLNDEISDIDISLMILKKYLQAMNTDSLTAESVEGKGTRISVALTFAREGEDTADTSLNPDELPDLTGTRIMVVDDNKISLEIGKRLLLPRGAEVVTAENGREALELYCRNNGRFDLIFMDILMPVMDGLEATKAIRSLSNIPGSLEVPIVAMTANAFRKNFEESFRAGMNAHLVKPIEPVSFYRIIAQLLGSRK